MVIKNPCRGIIVLFICVSFPPIIAENTRLIGKESNNNVDFEEVKEYLFQTIIDTANNKEIQRIILNPL